MNSSTSSSSVRIMMRFLVRFVLFGVSLFIVLELFFRFILHADEYARGYQDELYMVSRFDTTWITEGISTQGQFCREEGHWRINNSGWNSMFDYTSRTNHERSRIAIVGDSYIEGWALDVEDHVDAILYRLLEGTADVYAFGVSGVNFAQQVGMIRYIEEEFNPDIYCILVDHYPPEKSLETTCPFRFYILEDSTGFQLKCPSLIFTQNPYGRTIFRSAFARYLKLNKQIFVSDTQEKPDEQGGGDTEHYEENDIIQTERDIAITSFLVDTLIKIIPEDRIIFFSDARRSAIYSGEASIPPVNNYLLLETVQQNYPIYLIDLTQAFSQDYKLNKVKSLCWCK